MTMYFFQAFMKRPRNIVTSGTGHFMSVNTYVQVGNHDNQSVVSAEVCCWTACKAWSGNLEGSDKMSVDVLSFCRDSTTTEIEKTTKITTNQTMKQYCITLEPHIFGPLLTSPLDLISEKKYKS